MMFIQASDETLHLVLETLQSAIKSGLSACLSILFFSKKMSYDVFDALNFELLFFHMIM